MLFDIFEELDIPFAKKEIVMVYSGVVKLGIDSSKLEITPNKSATGEVKSVDVKLPPIEILSNEINRGENGESSISFPLEKRSLFNNLKTEDYNKLEETAKAKMAEVIKDRGMLEKAEEYAKANISGFITGAYGKEVQINFK